jgi:hypothetical protein
LLFRCVIDICVHGHAQFALYFPDYFSFITTANIMSKQTTTNKCKSDGTSAASKKARSSAPPKGAHAVARELVASINASPETFDLPEDDDDVHRTLVSLAAYAKTLEPAKKSSSQIATEVARLRRTVVSGIKKQMTLSLNVSPYSGTRRIVSSPILTRYIDV